MSGLTIPLMNTRDFSRVISGADLERRGGTYSSARVERVSGGLIATYSSGGAGWDSFGSFSSIFTTWMSMICRRVSTSQHSLISDIYVALKFASPVLAWRRSWVMFIHISCSESTSERE